MQYQIKRGVTTIATVRPASGEQRKEIMLTNTVSMAFTLDAAVQFAIGDTVEVFGETYFLARLPEPQKDSSIKHQYSLSFVALYYRLEKSLFFFYDSLNELWQLSEFQIMCTAESALDLVIANANREQTGWIKGDVDETATKQLSFSGTETVLQALTQIAQEFNLEWWVFNQTIHLTKKGSDSGYSFEYGFDKGLRGGLKRTNLDTSSAFSRLYVRGSDQNLPADYRGGQKRLMLPAPQQFIQGPLYGPDEIERPVTFEDIKPERVGIITAVGDKYTFSDAALDFDINAQLMPGVSAKVVFQTGQCAGYTFEIAQGGYNHDTRTITILKVDEETALEMPSDVLKPAIGDKYILEDIIMPDSYRDDAEERLLDRAETYFAENAPPKVAYTVPPDHFFFEREDIQLNLGDYVHINETDIGLNRDIRITAFARSLEGQYRYTALTLSDAVKGAVINGKLTDAEKLNKAIALNKFTNIQRARNNWRTTSELTTLLNTIKAEMLLIMLEGGAYTSNITTDIEADEISTSAGRVVHNQYTQGNGIWEVSALVAEPLPDDKPYYLYIKAGRATGTAIMIVSETKLAVESDPLYYYFPFGVASSIIDGGRLFTSLRGYTRVTGDTISLGRIVANNGGSFFDLNSDVLNIGDDDSGLDWNLTETGQLTVRGDIVATGARFINLVVENLHTNTTGFKRIEIDATDNNIKLIDATDEELLVIDDDAAIIGYTIDPDPPHGLIPIYGAGILIGNTSGDYLSLAQNGVRTNGDIEASKGVFVNEVVAKNLQTEVFVGSGSLPAAGLILADGNCNLYTTPKNGQIQRVKNITAFGITIDAAETPGRKILDGTGTLVDNYVMPGNGFHTFIYYQPDNYWVQMY